MNWNRRPWLLGLLLLIGLLLLASYSLTVGARHIPLPTIWKALVNYDPSQVDELLVQTFARTATPVGRGLWYQFLA